MDHESARERIKSLEEISARHEAREIEGCTSWRHRAVHEDRAWLLNALATIRQQVEKIRVARDGSSSDLDKRLAELIDMFEKHNLNHIGD